MKTLYLDVSAGCAGDMLLGALYQLCPDPEGFLAAMNALPLDGVSVRPEPVSDHGLAGVHMAVAFHGAEEGPDGPHGHHSHGHHRHVHRSLADVVALIRGLPLPEAVLDDACAVYGLVAGAEARAHNTTPGEVHFHEVGTNDAIADIVGVSLLLHAIGPDAVVATDVAVGGGTVHCAHGELPVPAPATAALLEGLPTVHGPADRELCTPTGAALLRRFVTRWAPFPAAGGTVGRGMGTRRFDTHCNTVAARLVETA